ncbi:MAG TPA: hypothetical protein VK966_07595, partial [Longimicrobiales bacterium]|nr:hypothetical protein [Longimicrobiales bacterium]
AVPGLRGSEATRALALVTLLGTVSDEGGMVVGEAMRLVDAGEPGGAVDLVERRVPELPAEDRPAMLTFAAELADRGQLRDDARRVRRHLLDTYPRSEAAPEALLALARGLRGEGDGALEARELLERLIMEYPRSALVPQARRELQQMTRGNAGDVEKRGSG